MKETQYVTNIKNAFEEVGAKVVKYVGNEFGEKGTPDLIGVIDCVPFVIEAKVGINQPSEIQIQRLREWADAGSVALLVTYPMHTPENISRYFYMSDLIVGERGTWEQWQADFEAWDIEH